MSANLSPPVGYSSADLVFNDSFLGTTLDSSTWDTFVTNQSLGGAPWNGNGDGGSGLNNNDSAAYFEPSQVNVDNGLTLTAVQQSVAGVTWGSIPYTFPWTSGAVSTYGKLEFTGGYLQVSMQEPAGDGAWPAIWLLNGATASVDQWEIDVQEGGAANNPTGASLWTLHYGDYYTTIGGNTNTGKNLTSGLHTYGIDWDPGKYIIWYVDGQEVGAVTSAQAPIPDQPMFLLMNLDVATSAASTFTTPDNSTPSSMTMSVADVQIYQKSGETITGSNVPSIAISNSDQVVTGASQVINGIADASCVGATVTVLDNGVQIGSALVDATGNWSAHVTLASASNLVSASVNNAYATGTSNSVVLDLNAPVGPSVIISNPQLTVFGDGGLVRLGLEVYMPSFASSSSVRIGGLASYDVLTDGNGDTFSGSSFTLSAAQVNSGLTLTSNCTTNMPAYETFEITSSYIYNGITYSSQNELKVTDIMPTNFQLGNGQTVNLYNTGGAAQLVTGSGGFVNLSNAQSTLVGGNNQVQFNGAASNLVDICGAPTPRKAPCSARTAPFLSTPHRFLSLAATTRFGWMAPRALRLTYPTQPAQQTLCMAPTEL